METWGCTGKALICKPTMVDEDETTKTQFWSCPIRFIPNSVLEFIRMYRFYQNHPSASFPCYDDVSPRYLQAEAFLHSEMTRKREGGE